MKPRSFDYVRPVNLVDALQALNAAGEGGKVLAGGQSLIPTMNFRLATPDTIIDIGRVSELNGVLRNSDTIAIGAGVTQRQAELDKVIRESCRAIPLALRWVGHIQNRNRGTVCGSIAHADPSAEMPAVALALDARFTLQSVGGTRVVAAADFFEAPFWTTIADDEIMVDVRFPVDSPTIKVAIEEVARRSGDFAIAGVVLRLELNDQIMSNVSAAAFGVAGTPVRLPRVEASMEGQRLSRSATMAAAVAARADLPRPTHDTQADSAYRRDAVEALVDRSLRRFAEEMHSTM